MIPDMSVIYEKSEPCNQKKIPWQLCLISDIRNDLNHVSKIKGVAKL